MGKARTTFLVIAVLAIALSGCIKSMLLDGQIKGTREGIGGHRHPGRLRGRAIIAFSGLGQFEGMHQLAPGNEDALFLLTKGWTATAFAFIEDDYEAAVDADDEPRAEYHRASRPSRLRPRLRTASRSRDATLRGSRRRRPMSHRSGLTPRSSARATPKTFCGSGRRGSPSPTWPKTTPRSWPSFTWARHWSSEASSSTKALAYGAGHAALGAYHARTAMAELDSSHKHFGRAIAADAGQRAPAEVPRWRVPTTA